MVSHRLTDILKQQRLRESPVYGGRHWLIKCRVRSINCKAIRKYLFDTAQKNDYWLLLFLHKIWYDPLPSSHTIYKCIACKTSTTFVRPTKYFENDFSLNSLVGNNEFFKYYLQFGPSSSQKWVCLIGDMSRMQKCKFLLFILIYHQVSLEIKWKWVYIFYNP